MSDGKSFDIMSDNQAATSTEQIIQKDTHFSISPADEDYHRIPKADGTNPLRLNDEGYLVVSDLLTEDEITSTAQSIREAVFRLVFNRRGHEVDPYDPESLILLTNKLAREQAGVSDDTVWMNNNTRKPRINKSTGMSNIHFDETKLQNIDFNPQLYEAASQVNDTPYLAFRAGAERICLKAKGSTDMKRHIDKNPFHPEINHPRRIQSLVCLSIDTEINPRDSGTTNLLVNYHHYWEMAAALFHPVSGLLPLPDNKRRFYVLPTNWMKKYEPALQEHITGYTQYLHQGIAPADRKVLDHYNTWRSMGITVPSEIKRPYWKPIPMKPGDVLFWTQDLPHQSLRNKSMTPRIVAYYNLFAIDKEWYDTPEREWLVHQFTNCQFHYDTNNGIYSYDIANPDEYEELTENNQIEQRSAISRATPLARQITGQERYPSLTE